jgi:hypothetical protein
MKTILFLLVAILAYQNNASLNLTKNQVIIVSLIAYYFLFMQKEKFALSSGLIPFIDTTSKNALIDTTFYDTGILDPTKQIQTETPARNGGLACGSFPTRVYRVTSPQPAVNATCRIGASGPTIAPGPQAALTANVDAHYNFTNSPVNLGSTIKGSTSL